MGKLDNKLFKFIQNHKNVNITTQAIRNEISKTRHQNPGITLNAAAAIFANKKGFKVMRYLNTEDRKSLQNIPISNTKTSISKSTPKIKKKAINPSYGTAFITGANENAEVYPYVYILENSLRKLILDTYQSDPKWWETRAPKAVKDHADYIKKAEKKHDWLPNRGNHPIYYVGLEALFKIISKNYNPSFKKVFTDQGNLRTWINECLPIRNLLAHNIRIKKEERDNLKIRTKYICTLIENNFYKKQK